MNYREITLREAIHFKNGKKRPTSEGNIPVYGGNGVLGYAGESNYDHCIIIGRVGAYCGSVYLEEGKCWVSDNAIAAVPSGDNDTKFFYYLLKGLHLNERHIGTSQPLLTQEILNKINCEVPSYPDQQRIAELLSSLDRKINVNRKLNDNLQQQVAALFANFYDRAETEVGFTEIIQILGGGTPKTGESSYWNGNVPFFTPKDVGSPYTLATEKTITEEGLAHCNSRLYPVNTVFVTARGTVGKVGLPGIPMAMNQSCYALVGKDTHQLLVYFYTLKAVDRLKHKASGAVFDAITTRDFESEIIMKLSDDDEKAFLDVAQPIYQAVLSNSIENLRFAALRDSLLPKLMSGEIDVSGVQL